MDLNELIEKYSLPSAPPEAHYTVYKLTDPDGKVYIGCTGKTVEERWKNGWNYNCHSGIFKAIRKFGWVNFEKKILCEKLTREGAGKLEKWFIAYYDSASPEKGYNRALGGLGKGVRMSEATKETCSKSIRLLYKKDPVYRERLSKSKIKLFDNNYELPKKNQALRICNSRSTRSTSRSFWSFFRNWNTFQSHRPPKRGVPFRCQEET